MNMSQRKRSMLFTSIVSFYYLLCFFCNVQNVVVIVVVACCFFTRRLDVWLLFSAVSTDRLAYRLPESLGTSDSTSR